MSKTLTDSDFRQSSLEVKKNREAVRSSPKLARPAIGKDLQAAAVTRLALVAVLVVIFSVVLRLVLPQSPGTPPTILALRLGALLSTVTISLAVSALAWWRMLPPQRLLNLALLYEVVQSLLFAISFHAIGVDANTTPRGWDTVALWILTFPLVIPATRVKTFVATILAALMDPLGLAVALAAGSPMPSRETALAIFLRTGFAVVAALLVSGLLYRLSAEVADAREMGAYRLIEQIGRGGMGEVWRAEHRALARPAAIKLIRPETLAGNGRDVHEAISRFEREARATAALRSPHTVAVYDFGTAEDGSLYYVMELLDGYDTHTLVQRYGPLPPERVVKLLRQVCDSLEEAHRAGMVHRDIKPANILICRYGLELDFVKVVDFGLVKGTPDSVGNQKPLTSASVIAGTPEYMSPETALARFEVDWRSDIYSLGCVAYWMLTGKPVFESKSPLRLVLHHTATPPTPPSKRTDRVIPKGLEQIVLECLSKDPLQRPQTAGELSDRLAALGMEGAWTRRDAETWWLDHPPERNDAAARESLVLARKSA